MRRVTLHVCQTCRREGDDPAAPRQGAKLRDELAAEVPDWIDLVPVDCLGNCRRSCSVALSAPGAWTYVFGDLDAGSVGDILTAAGLMRDTIDGLMPWRGRPESFKRGMIARIPPTPSSQEAAE